MQAYVHFLESSVNVYDILFGNNSTDVTTDHIFSIFQQNLPPPRKVTNKAITLIKRHDNLLITFTNYESVSVYISCSLCEIGQKLQK